MSVGYWANRNTAWHHFLKGKGQLISTNLKQIESFNKYVPKTYKVAEIITEYDA